MGTTFLTIPSGLGQLTYGNEYITSILKTRLQIVPGFEKLANVIEDEDGQKSSFVFTNDDNGINLELHVVVIPRTQMIAVSADIKELLFYVFKQVLNVDLASVKIFIEA